MQFRNSYVPSLPHVYKNDRDLFLSDYAKTVSAELIEFVISELPRENRDESTVSKILNDIKSIGLSLEKNGVESLKITTTLEEKDLLASDLFQNKDDEFVISYPIGGYGRTVDAIIPTSRYRNTNRYAYELCDGYTFLHSSMIGMGLSVPIDYVSPTSGILIKRRNNTTTTRR